jgi:hypothetical protein
MDSIWDQMSLEYNHLWAQFFYTYKICEWQSHKLYVYKSCDLKKEEIISQLQSNCHVRYQKLYQTSWNTHELIMCGKMKRLVKRCENLKT